MKTWSYKTVTERAEKEIKSLMEQYRKDSDEFAKRLHHDWAYGVFLGWKELTMGWQNDGDCERLESLCNYKN